jgi:hypothetical protein
MKATRFLLNASLLALLILVQGSLAQADSSQVFDPSVGDVWTYPGGEFRYTGTGEWFEYKDGVCTFSFREISRDWQRIELFDATRNIIVELTRSVATVRRGGQVLLTIQRNTRASEWNYANGAGRFVETGPGGWAEYQNGQLVYFFQEISRVGEEVYLYDSGRDIHVRLVRGEATVTRDGVLLVIIQGSFAG